MVSCVRIAVLMVWIATEMVAQVPKEENARKQASATEEGPAAQTGRVDYPLNAFRDFSAIMVGSRMGVGDSSDGSHIYRSGDLVRVEGSEKHGYFITNLKTLETYGITEGPCAYSKHPYFGASPFPAAQPGTTVTRVPVSKETFDGHSCQVEDVTVSSKNPGANALKMRIWEADDLQGFPVKIEFPSPGGKSATILYKNVVLGPQDPTLFIHPKSCESLESMNTKTPKGKAPAKKSPTDSSKK